MTQLNLGPPYHPSCVEIKIQYKIFKSGIKSLIMDGLWSLRCQNDRNELADVIGTFIIGTIFLLVVKNGN